MKLTPPSPHRQELRNEDGKVIEHWAVRDDLGQAKQLGWLPPSPTYLNRMAIIKRRVKRGNGEERHGTRLLR